MFTRCYCKTSKCNGALISYAKKRSHERADLRNHTVIAQAQHKRLGTLNVQVLAGPVPRGFAVPLHEPSPPLSPDVEFHDPIRTSDCAVEQEMLDHGTLTGEDLDLMVYGSDLPNLGPNFHSPDALLAAVDHFSEYNTRTEAGAHPLTAHIAHHLPPDPERRAAEHQLEAMLEEVRKQQEHADNMIIEEELLGDARAEFEDLHLYEDSNDIELEEVLVNHGHPNEDSPDPFVTDDKFSSSFDTDFSHVPPHLLTIYALVTWLHLQFHLPRAACNALLAVFACLLLTVSPGIETPFVTLQSSNRVLGVDAPILTLPVCPVCRNVYPPASSRLSHDECTDCNVPLFLPCQTKRGNNRTTKTPIVKYPYLPLSEQIKSMLKIPGLEAVLDNWRSKPRSVGTYTDIFDGEMCRKKLKDSDGNLFFSNTPEEKNGPNGELRIGVNLGVDWQLSPYKSTLSFLTDILSQVLIYPE